MPAPRKNQTQQKRQRPLCRSHALYRHASFANHRSKTDYPAPPHHHSYRHHTRRATVCRPRTPSHAESTHGEHSWRLAYLLFFTRGHGEGGYRRADNHPKNKQHPTTSALPSFRSRRQFIPQTPICQTKRQSVLWKYHTSFYVINNPPGEQPHQGAFRVAPTRTQKTHAVNPKKPCRETFSITH